MIYDCDYFCELSIIIVALLWCNRRTSLLQLSQAVAIANPRQSQTLLKCIIKSFAKLNLF